VKVLKKKHYDVVAAIDVGTHNLQMAIAQVHEDGTMEILEELTQPTAIGSEAFQTGRISAKAIHDTVQVLRGFAKMMNQYQVKNYNATATSAFREAENREYVLEQIRMQTGLVVAVINSAQERFYMYKALRYSSPGMGFTKAEQSALVVNIASGGVEFSVYEEGSLALTEYIDIGSLRLHEKLSALRHKTIDYSRVMEEYINSKLDLIKPFISKANIQYFVGLGSELNTIFRICPNKKDNFLDNMSIESLYHKIIYMQNDQIEESYNLTAKQVETLLPSVLIINSLLKMANAKKVFIPMVELRHGIIHDLADQMFSLKRQEDLASDIISSVWYIANKYGTYKKHSSQVAKLALSIFDQTKKLHRLGSRSRLYLQIAVILHSIGYFVNFSEQANLAYSLVKKQNIMGLSNQELELIANVIAYNGDEVPREHHHAYQDLAIDEKILVAKLAAILKLANSLDVCRCEKIKQVEITPKKGELLFKLQAKQNILLEEWTFAQRAGFFEEVLGMRPVIKKIG